LNPRAIWLVLGAATSVQFGAALAATLFDQLGPGGTVWLRLLFAAGAGLAPVHHERHVARGGDRPIIDRDVFVDTSSYGPQALDALVRVLGIDVLALGSDRPYAEPLARLLGDAATHAIRSTNPRRLLAGDVARHETGHETRVEARTWSRAS